MAEVLNRKEQCARKTHHCELCNGEIYPGESYIRIAFTDGGRAYSFKQHIHCEALVERYCMAMGTDECDKWADACEHTALTCPKVLKALLPPTLLTHEDVRRHIESEETQDG